jgi:hypothetical protein
MKVEDGWFTPGRADRDYVQVVVLGVSDRVGLGGTEGRHDLGYRIGMAGHEYDLSLML